MDLAGHRRVNERGGQKGTSGFSLLELMIVVAVIIIATAIAIPSVKQTIGSYQLDSAGRMIASLLETGRLTAVKTNQPYYVLYSTGLCASPLVCAVPATGSPNPPDGSNYASVDPTVAIPSSVSFQTVTPDHTQLDDYLGGAGVTVVLNQPIGFNARGLPCMASAGTPLICQQAVPNSGGTPAFEWFMQSATTQSWEAITVTPAGRIRSWRLTSTQASGSACGYPACWQ